ncbi:uncharacterized protein LOC133800034 [Humulus lupulus]|uniref:uncharacterized protein LOC133800034 n=1 Tax=Humulus lupulus TaxID=3486 RepID=UPI002B40B783|nr:uncharacterized protein LOC133800034 [Humulus lupulus]
MAIEDWFPYWSNMEIVDLILITFIVEEGNKQIGQTYPISTSNKANITSVNIMRIGKGGMQQNAIVQSRKLLKVVPSKPYLLKLMPRCTHCKAKRFPHETTGFCCGNGKISLTTNDVPKQLLDLFTRNTNQSIHFRTYIRTYNNKFAFTSFGVNFDKDLCRRNKGIYTFRTQGQIYHYINDLLPSNGRPSYLQLYFYDTDNELQNQILDSDRMVPSIVAQLIDILQINPYSIFFRSLGDLEDLENQTILIRTDPGLDQRVFNAPTSSQVAAILVENNEGEQLKPRDIFVHNHLGGNHKVQYYFGCYDPLQYPLLFPFGDIGWHQGIKRVNRGDKSIYNETNHSILPQQSINADELIVREEQGLNNVDKGPIIETSRLDYFRSNQNHFRTEIYQGIVDTITLGERNASNVGKRMILPSSFIGGPRDMRKRYMEAMTLVQRYGKPDIFLTMTCNPNWPEISNELLQHEEPQNRPDLVARVLHSKLEQLKDELFKKKIFGQVSAYVYVIEHQKRGLPHAHFLIILQRDWKLYTPESFDEIVSAEIPYQNTNIHLHNAVVKHMMHGPCGVLNPSNVCMKRNGCCKSNYPKKYAPNTNVGSDCFPIYKRSDNGVNVKVRGKNLDNRWVVPYNPYLLATFDCHINVEICSTIKAVKYLYKYTYKGHDRVAFNLISEENNHQVDEIQQFQSARWIAPPEAMWRIYGLVINEMYPTVYSLHLHLEDQQSITFQAKDDLTNIVNSDQSRKTMLTEFFAMNQIDANARRLLYKEFPENYVWNHQHKQWTPRKKKTVIGRIVTANPLEGERYYLRLLLTHLKGPISFQDIRSIDGIVVPTFRDAATLHGLLQRDNNLEECLQEASLFQMPASLRRLFATILVYCNPTNPRYLWERFENEMSVDFKPADYPTSNVRIQVLRSIALAIDSLGKDINSYNLTNNDISFDDKEIQSREINDEMGVEVPEEDITASKCLNSEQQHVYDAVLEKVLENKSGVAASILPGGRTAHSRFKLPLGTSEMNTCSVSKQSGLASLLRTTRLIIWDEAPMTRKQHIEALDKMLRDITDVDVTFGGKVVILGGDFRQVLPVVRKGTREEQVRSSLVYSYLWPSLTKFHLIENMRARLDPAFSDYVLKVGNGMPPNTVNEMIKIPTCMLIPYVDDKFSLDRLIEDVFHNIHNFSQNISSMMKRAILTPKNDFVDEINTLLIHRFPGEEQRYYSFDETTDSSEQSVMEDFLNNLTPNGLPPHELLLKKNFPIMLLRNINPSEGLCNGTRLICRAFDKNIIDAEIAVGHYNGKRVDIEVIHCDFFFKALMERLKDLLAVVIKISPAKDVTTMHGIKTIQEIYLIDKSFNPICLTMWGQFVKYDAQKISEIVDEKPIILATNISVKSYRGLTLSTTSSNNFTINPALPQATTMRKCARAYAKINENTGSISVIMFGHVAEEMLGCSAVQLMEHSEESWTIQIYADPEKLKQQQYKNFNVYSIQELQLEEVVESSS